MGVRSWEELKEEPPRAAGLAVLGDPVKHSLSPAMHNAALAAMRAAGQSLEGWKYEAVHVPAEELPEALPLLHGLGFRGLNLTIPHKVRVLPLLEELDASARGMGAANTLIRTGSGYRGSNTDGYGILKAMEEAFGVRPRDRDVWLFGAGGAARGIAVACLGDGADRLTIVNRGAERLEELKRQLQPVEGAGRLRFFRSEEAPDDSGEGALYINATSLGLRADDPLPFDDRRLRPGLFVYDTTYGCRNRLRKVSGERGIPYADGLPMLVWQGVRSLEIWTGAKVPAEVMRAAAEGGRGV
ncbi:MAG: shikimate dehydrogenase [Verrucomicrobia bacterium]|jgi:shikimate dehydrogenase|nr:shikimate dehydrogenase [Verrucomicrobiota bacterium]